jgi:putative transposase
MIQAFIRSLKRFASRVKQHLKQWSKPAIGRITVGSLSDLRRSRKDLIIENAILRQQLIVLNRQVKRPQLTQGDRVRFVLLARLTEFWRQALHIVQPDTLLRWHRDLFCHYWRRKSKPEKREPRTSHETIELIKQMARENRLWGAERIRGELLKLGVKVSKRTIQKYMLKERQNRSGQSDLGHVHEEPFPRYLGLRFHCGERSALPSMVCFRDYGAAYPPYRACSGNPISY